MECPLCKLEGRVQLSRYVVENDTTPDKETKLFNEFNFICVNSNCPNNGKVFETQRIPLSIG